jgi:hypothetical protein
MHSDTHCRCDNNDGGDLIFILKANAIVLIILIFVIIFQSHHDMVKDSLWKQEPVITLSENMDNFYFLGENQYQKEKWSYTYLDNGNILINPFEMHLLCHIKSLPQNTTLLNEISTTEIIQAKQNHTLLIVKPMAVSWQDNDDMIQKAKSCPDVDISGQYIKYRGHTVFELVSLKDEHQSILKQSGLSR